MKVAILGASGIGKNHARWFKTHGADVVAILGSSPESVSKTKQQLQENIGFEGEGFTEIEALIAGARPDAVCISSPNDKHFEHAKTCIENGIDVLCEKPIVYNPNQSDAENLQQARDIATLAKSRIVLFGMQTQYTFAAPAFCEFAGVKAEDVEEFSMVMETKNLVPGREGRKLWVDLAPHPLSVVQILAPDAELDESSIEFTLGDLRSEARFQVRRTNGKFLKAHVNIGCVPGHEPQRTVTLNGQTVEYAGFRDTDGVFKAKVWREGKEAAVLPDFVDSLIGNFVLAVNGETGVVRDAEFGVQNLDWLLKLSA